jgi:phosphohistidine phosphatase
MDLYVVRHAVAFERDPEEWSDDCERPLTGEGERAFRRAARGLDRLVKPVPAVLSSPCVRAWRTAEILAEEANWGEPEALEALRPGRSAKDALAALAEHGDEERLAVVGHEPMLGALCGALAGGAALELKKGGVVRLRVTALARGGARLRWVLPPDVLKRLGR